VSNFNPVDPYFTRIRDTQTVELLIDGMSETHLPEEPSTTDSNVSLPLVTAVGLLETDDETAQPSLFGSLFQNLQSIILESRSTVDQNGGHTPVMIRQVLPGALPTGPGAAPIPDLDEPSDLDMFARKSPLPWSTLFIADELCDGPLDAQVVKEHHILVIRRGGCSFSHKLTNIPSFAPGARALQLVIIVSSPEQDEADYNMRRSEAPNGRRPPRNGEMSMIQPLLDQTQATAAGLPRPHPIPAVMIGGGKETMEMLRHAKGIGVRRRWWFESQGVRISNLIVL